LTHLTPKVLKFDGPSEDGRRHRRGTYLLSLLFINLPIYNMHENSGIIQVDVGPVSVRVRTLLL
jgi:hypothetical protein